MNYKKHYELLVDRARNRKLFEHKEQHHIIPKCLGGSNLKSNLIDLTPEEHYLAHQLLVKIYPENRKLVYALSACCMSKNGIRNNKMYGWIKKINIAIRKEKVQTEESNNKRREKLRGRKTSSGMQGNKHREDSKAAISLSQKGKMKYSPRTIYAWLISPSNENILFGPLLYESKKYNLILDYVSDLCKGKKKVYKGWTFGRFATDEERMHKVEMLQMQGLMI